MDPPLAGRKVEIGCIVSLVAGVGALFPGMWNLTSLAGYEPELVCEVVSLQYGKNP